MTRRVRSGNTQKHKKMPGDATKWGEFDNQTEKKISPKKRNNKKIEPNFEQNSNSVCVASNFSTSEITNQPKNNEKLYEKQNTHTLFVKKKSNKKIKLENDSSYETVSNELSSNLKQDVKLNASPDRTSNPNKSSTEQKDSHCKRQKKKMRMKQNNIGNDSKNSVVDDKTQMSSSAKMLERKKEMYMKKLQKKRDDMGILLLPAKVERKLYIIRKRLKEKGYPPHLQKEIMRKERRKEELKFRKTFNPSKLCFHCREAGHLFADCPKKSGSSNQETGICFKCGSAEHTSFKCPERIQGFPFAKCFICKEQGHISKDCPRNKHGVYPKGGRCNLCGNVNHLKKDCPSLMKKKNDESNITLHTIDEDTSIDAEVMEKEEVKERKMKKPKIVKF